MKKPNLDQLLQDMAQLPPPAVPFAFQQDVWREIRHRKAVQALSWRDNVDVYLGIFLQPAPVAVSLVLALLVGVAGALPGHRSIPPGLDVFDPKASGLNILGKL